MADLGYKQTGPTKLHMDNQGAIALGSNPMIGDKSKHIILGYHYVKEQHAKGTITFQWVNSKEQLADFLTKPLATDAFQHISTHAMGNYNKHQLGST